MAVYAEKSTYVAKKAELDKVQSPKQLVDQLFEEMSRGQLGQIDPFYNPIWDAYRNRAKELTNV